MGVHQISTSLFVRAIHDIVCLQRKFAKPEVRRELVTADLLSGFVGSLGTSP